jgi:MEDS: MEthanogen/methylotroph, DcmR Sensory domain
VRRRFDQHKKLALFEGVAKDAKEKGFPLIGFVTQMEWALETELDLNDLLKYEAKANEVWLRQDGHPHVRSQKVSRGHRH